MTVKRETFASLLQSHGYRYDLRPVFDDFLTLTLCAFSQNPLTKKSYDEDLYLETINRYPKDMADELFSKLLALLILEMEEGLGSDRGNDVLGNFYEQNFCRKGTGQFFTPWHVCRMMAECVHGGKADTEVERLRILDPSCGSGRTLLAGTKVFGHQHDYFGIDIDLTCVKMTAINLFLNGVFHGEIMCADALSPDDFRVSYRLSFLPFGIFRIDDKEKSRLWHAQCATFKVKEQMQTPDIVLPSQEGAVKDIGSQLQLF